MCVFVCVCVCVCEQVSQLQKSRGRTQCNPWLPFSNANTHISTSKMHYELSPQWETEEGKGGETPGSGCPVRCTRFLDLSQCTTLYSHSWLVFHFIFQRNEDERERENEREGEQYEQQHRVKGSYLFSICKEDAPLHFTLRKHCVLLLWDTTTLPKQCLSARVK